MVEQLYLVNLLMFSLFIQPSIELFNLRIDEPVTTITDILLALICFYAFYRIRQMESSERIKRYFKYYFLTLGLAALSGGILGHAFLYRLAPAWKLVSWLFTLASVGILAHGLTLLAKPLLKPSVARWTTWLNVLVLAVALLYTLWSMAFSGVKYYTIFGMVVVVGSLSYVIFHRTGSRGMVKLMVAVGVGILSAVVFSYEWGLTPWFNHNDISHLILSYSAFTIYQGAVAIVEAPTLI